MNSYIDLDRKYRTLTQKDLEHAETLSAADYFDSRDARSWRELVENPRVVLLAEAGAGKTEELRHMANVLRGEGRYAFFIEIESLGRKSLRDSLSAEDETLLDAWKADGRASAWFFLDAVDELKLTQVRFDSALQTFAKGVGGLLERLNVVVACRPNDWRAVTDMEALTRLLPRHSPGVREMPSADAFFELLERQEATPKSSEKQVTNFLTVVLVPLTDPQIRTFVRERGANAEDFAAELDRRHAWDFARRPLDLIELVDLWKVSGKLGTRVAQHEANVNAKLREKPDRADNDVLSSDMAAEGAERLALALALTRTRSLRTPDQPLLRERAIGVLSPAEVLQDWTEAQVLALLRRGLFDPATYGRVRFHHRSVQEYLAARRLLALRSRGMSIKALFGLLFAETYGVKVLVPSMRPIAAWLALWLDEVRREVVAREPEVLLRMGDPEALTLAAKREILRSFVAAYGQGGWRGVRVPIDEVRRLSDPRLDPTIRELWVAGKTNEDSRELLLELIWKSQSPGCLDIAERAANDRSYSPYHRLLGVRALLDLAQEKPLRKIAKNLLGSRGGWPRKSVATVAAALFPIALTVDELLILAERTPEAPSSTEGFKWEMRGVCNDIQLGPDAEKLRNGLVKLIEGGAEQNADIYNPTSSLGHLAPGLRVLCMRQWVGSNWGETSEFVTACVVGHRYRNSPDDHQTSELTDIARDTDATLRRAFFWADVDFVDRAGKMQDSWNRMYLALYEGLLKDFQPSDRSWLLEDLLSMSREEDKKVALEALLWIWRSLGRSPSELGQLRQACGEEEALLATLNEISKPPSPSPVQLELEKKQKERTEAAELRKELRLLEWDAWRHEVLVDSQRAFEPAFQRHNTYLFMKWLSGSSFPQSKAWDRSRIVRAFNDDVAVRLTDALCRYWRAEVPSLPTERPPVERNSYPDQWFVGLVGLFVESRTRGWAERLSQDEVRLAVRYAILELNGFPEWLADLAKAQPQIVREVLSVELRAQVAEKVQARESLPLLQSLSHASGGLKTLLYETCKEIFINWQAAAAGSGRKDRSSYYLPQLFEVLAESADEDERLQLAEICRTRLQANKAGPLSITWLKLLLKLDIASGASELDAALAVASPQEAVEMVAALFGRTDRDGRALGEVDADAAAAVLGRLLRAAFRTVRPEDDVEHEGVYTPAVRDDAERGRSYLFSALVSTPGKRARDELMALARDPLLGDLQERLRHLARERAANDSEFEDFQPADIRALDARLEKPPKSRDALFLMMIDRLGDLQHDIAHHDFSDRRTLRDIGQEVEMQRTLAMRLEAMSKGNYTVTRESEVADSKRTDIVLAASGSLQKAVIEIKIADDRWRLVQLERALTGQLVALYERHENCRAGCLLLTNNGTRNFWQKSGVRLDWPGLVHHLQSLAQEVEAGRNSELRVAVFGLDLRDPALP